MKGLRYLISLQDKVSAVADRIGGKVRNLVGRMDGLKAKLGEVNTKLGISTGWTKFTGFLKGATKGIWEFLKGAGKIAGVMAGVAVGIGAAAMPAVDAAMQKSNDERVITFSSGKDSIANLEFLYDTIDKFNLPLKETRAGFAQVTGAFKDTVLQGQPMRDIFEGVSTATLAMNLSGDTSQGVFLALSQIMSKGKLSAEELTGQLGERLPGALGIAARSMGVSTGKLMEMMQNGEVMATDFLPKFAAELKKTFGEEAVKAAQSPQAMLTRLKNKFEDLKIAVGESLMPTFIKMATKLTEGLERAVPYVKIVMDWFEKMYLKLSPYIDAIKKNLGVAFAGFDGSVLISYLENVILFAAKVITSLTAIFASIAPYFAMIGNNLSQIFTPLGLLVDGFLALLAVVAPIFMQLLAWIVESVDLGGILSRVFLIVTSVFNSVATILGVVWKVFSPIIHGLIEFVGWIVNNLAGLGLTVLELVAGAFGKIATGVGLAYDYVVSLLEAVGLLDKKSVTVKVQENISKVANPSGVTGSKYGSPSATGTASPSGSAPAGSKESAQKINEGGSRPVNISIKYDAMIKGGINIHTTNMKEGVKDLERQIEELILRSLNGATQMVR